MLNDKSYDLLCTSIEQNNMEEAFRAAHTLKGISQNLSLTILYNSSSVLSDVLRDSQKYDEKAAELFEQVKILQTAHQTDLVDKCKGPDLL